MANERNNEREWGSLDFDPGTASVTATMYGFIVMAKVKIVPGQNEIPVNPRYEIYRGLSKLAEGNMTYLGNNEWQINHSNIHTHPSDVKAMVEFVTYSPYQSNPKVDFATVDPPPPSGYRGAEIRRPKRGEVVNDFEFCHCCFRDENACGKIEASSNTATRATAWLLDLQGQSRPKPMTKKGRFFEVQFNEVRGFMHVEVEFSDGPPAIRDHECIECPDDVECPNNCNG